MKAATIQSSDMDTSEQWKNPGCLGYIGDHTTQPCGDYFINHHKDPVIKQPVFHGKYPSVFFCFPQVVVEHYMCLKFSTWSFKRFWPTNLGQLSFLQIGCFFARKKQHLEMCSFFVCLIVFVFVFDPGRKLEIWESKKNTKKRKKVCYPETFGSDTVDGSEIRRENQLRLVVFPLFIRFHASKRWCSPDFFHQQ